MRTSTELIAKVNDRLVSARRKNLEKLWEDFLNSVEKVINILTDEQLAATEQISLYYYTKKGKIYRGKIASCDFSKNSKIKYEEKDVFLGTKAMLGSAFMDLKEKAKMDQNVNESHFDADYFRTEVDPDKTIVLDFILPQTKNI